ncbi:quinone oxidoreductase family protein [Alkalilimnicola ehrlichii MLHE-1]|uniref:NADPH:quinone reductase n=1 Tax=Alkalilimnicola ehrlichii (strain ATCC BAA-1101 / DSM 17681 / MLHE-1) TaxID=187272 RepID=Q0A5S5_ALKEH|nr:quinone oxidoreductase [Alkalilimnicola ehrlichii]ABI57812.1 Alcohol dehydrogenase, zinc-binding domain protein [Alkalilimnicola ehrlichii MLHE-1]
MPHAIRIHETGGPDVLKWEPVEVGEPGPGEVRLRHTAVGLNYIDVYFRTGLYPPPGLPSGLGLEAAGVVEAVGDGVTEVAVGDRVVYASPPLGAYAEARLMPADRVVRLPDAIDDRTAAGMMLQGLTAWYLLHRTYPVKAGDTLLIHAAAGGVGLLVCQWAKHLGATVIGTVGSDEKAELARAHGCDHPIVYTRERFPDRVREITAGEGVPVVYDSIGKDTFEDSLDSLRPLGLMVSFGNASGPVPPLDLQLLSAKGSLFITRPTVMTYTARREDLLAGAQALFDVVQKGVLKVAVNQSWPLAQAAEAHKALEARQTTGSTVLTV